MYQNDSCIKYRKKLIIFDIRDEPGFLQMSQNKSIHS